jgi:hypothetical protein
MLPRTLGLVAGVRSLSREPCLGLLEAAPVQMRSAAWEHAQVQRERAGASK